MVGDTDTDIIAGKRAGTKGVFLGEQDPIVVCLSHLGITEDELLEDECPEIDVIFGSHTHHVLPEGKVINGVLLDRKSVV